VVRRPAGKPAAGAAAAPAVTPASAPPASQPPPPVPTAPADNTDWGALRDRLIRAQAQAATADSVVDEMRQRLRAQGLTLNAQTSADHTAMRMYLDEAKAECGRRNGAACQSNLEKAELKARQVLKYFGR
jgi:hypothetical protein